MMMRDTACKYLKSKNNTKRQLFFFCYKQQNEQTFQIETVDCIIVCAGEQKNETYSTTNGTSANLTVLFTVKYVT